MPLREDQFQNRLVRTMHKLSLLSTAKKHAPCIHTVIWRVRTSIDTTVVVCQEDLTPIPILNLGM